MHYHTDRVRRSLIPKPLSIGELFHYTLPEWRNGLATTIGDSSTNVLHNILLLPSMGVSSSCVEHFLNSKSRRQLSETEVFFASYETGGSIMIMFKGPLEIVT